MHTTEVQHEDAMLYSGISVLTIRGCPSGDHVRENEMVNVLLLHLATHQSVGSILGKGDVKL